ncbi:zincin-like metallopeptidase domain-containing protein [Domibacillus tundrae]|uniref:zincin-like metallopeptidase domain-containing protein n=1 Tax=Domibacillus tundrae TaxID=1587527 RepID=UPI0033974F42
MENSASYIQSWLRVLKEESKLIVQAAAQAQKSRGVHLFVEPKIALLPTNIF